MHWQNRSTVISDVVFFRYIAEGVEKSVDTVFVWDLDKTYLDTAWAGVGDLFKLFLERPLSKKNVPGTNTLIRALIDQRFQQKNNRQLPLYFITASPPQMETRIAEKLAFDGINPYGAFYKDNLRNIRPKRLWRLTKQVGYKIQALMLLRLRLKPDVRQVLWGDDSESDAVIYNLYSDICARRLSPHELRHVLSQMSVSAEQADDIIHLQSQVPELDPVEKIYINLASDTDPEYYFKFGRRTVATYNSFQIILDLHQDKRVDFEKVLRVGQDLLTNYGTTQDELTRSLDELIRRKVMGEAYLGEFLASLQKESIIASDYLPSLPPAKVQPSELWRGFDLQGVHEPWIRDHIDYLNDYR